MVEQERQVALCFVILQGEGLLFGACEVEVSGHHVHVAVEQPGEDRLSRAVHNVITVQIGPDIDDVAAFDDEVGYACCGSVEDRSILEDCADCHCSSFHECSTAQVGRGGRLTRLGHLTTLTASPLRAVSLYLWFMSAPVSRMVAMTWSSERCWLPFAPERHSRGVDRFHCTDRVAFDAGTRTRPATGSQVSPRWCSSAISAAFST